jgi:hypothetical protein
MVGAVKEKAPPHLDLGALRKLLADTASFSIKFGQMSPAALDDSA